MLCKNTSSGVYQVQRSYIYKLLVPREPASDISVREKRQKERSWWGQGGLAGDIRFLGCLKLGCGCSLLKWLEVLQCCIDGCLRLNPSGPGMFFCSSLLEVGLRLFALECSPEAYSSTCRTMSGPRGDWYCETGVFGGSWLVRMSSLSRNTPKRCFRSFTIAWDTAAPFVGLSEGAKPWLLTEEVFNACCVWRLANLDYW